MFGCCGEMKRMIYFLEMQSENVLWRKCVCVDDLSYLNQKRKWEEEEIV